MIDMDYYRKIQNMGEFNDIRIAQKYEVQTNLNQDFSNTLDAYTVTINDVEQDLTILKTNNLDVKKIKSRPGETFYAGDIVEWMDSHWMILEVDTNDDIICCGKMKECNYPLKWQNEHGNVITRWVINTNSSSYSDGTDGNKTITVGSDQHMLLIPLDEETKKLHRDMRVMIFEDGCEAMVYKLTRPDSSSNVKKGHGYLCDILSEDSLNTQTDREDLKLCDYIETAITPPIPDPNVDRTTVLCTIYGRNELKLGYNRVYSAGFTDLDGNVLSDVEYDWNLNCDFADKITMTETETGITLRCDDEDYIEEEFDINIVVDGDVVGSKTIRVVGLY